MDGGELQHEDDVTGLAPCAAGSGRHSGSDQDGNNNDGDTDDGKDDNKNNGKDHVEEEGYHEEDEGDTTDGGPPQPAEQTASHTEEPRTVKRPHVKSRRMQEYQQTLTSQPHRPPRTCPVCGRTLYSGPGYRYHQRKHRLTNESFTCDNCRKVFKSSNGLKYHRKRKRCRGSGLSSTSTSHATSTLSSSSRTPPSLVLPGEKAERLMELAKIATGPQSPLLRSPGPDSRGSVTESFFDDSETSAVIALSSMKKRCTTESRRNHQGTSGLGNLQQQQTDRQQQQQQQLTDKAKRPMNGFMLFAQKNRAELNKKYPDMNNRMISTKLSEEWNKLAEEERQKWKDEARQKAEQHQKEHPDCWKRKK